MPRLRIRRGGAEELFELRKGVTVLGRADDCDVVVKDQMASRRHCEVVRNTDDTYKAVDLESRNGTRLNGNVFNQAQLQQGDSIEIGQVSLTFEWGRGDILPATAPSAEAPWARAKPPEAGGRVPVGRRTPRRQAPIGWIIGVVVAVPALLILSSAMRRGGGGGPTARYAAEQHAAAAERMKAEERFEEALAELRAIPREAPDLYEEAQREIPILEKAMRRRPEIQRAREAQALWDDLYKFHLEHPRETEEIRSRAQVIVRDYGGTVFAEKAAKVLQDIAEVAEAGAESAFRSVEGVVRELLERHRYAEALDALRAFLAAHPKSMDDVVEKRIAEILSAGQFYFQQEDARAQELAGQGQFKEAREIYEGMVDAVGDEDLFFEVRLRATREQERLKKLEEGG